MKTTRIMAVAAIAVVAGFFAVRASGTVGQKPVPSSGGSAFDGMLDPVRCMDDASFNIEQFRRQSTLDGAMNCPGPELLA